VAVNAERAAKQARASLAALQVALSAFLAAPHTTEEYDRIQRAFHVGLRNVVGYVSWRASIEGDRGLLIQSYALLVTATEHLVASRAAQGLGARYTANEAMIRAILKTARLCTCSDEKNETDGYNSPGCVTTMLTAIRPLLRELHKQGLVPKGTQINRPRRSR
jgi:hypothetical protein